jgi:hypothetical protein
MRPLGSAGGAVFDRFWGRSSLDEYGQDGDIPDDNDEYAGGRQTKKKTQQPTKNTWA